MRYGTRAPKPDPRFPEGPDIDEINNFVVSQFGFASRDHFLAGFNKDAPVINRGLGLPPQRSVAGARSRRIPIRSRTKAGGGTSRSRSEPQLLKLDHDGTARRACKFPAETGRTQIEHLQSFCAPASRALILYISVDRWAASPTFPISDRPATRSGRGPGPLDGRM
jgi:hypothetical protein